LAVSKEANRYYLCASYYDGEYLVGTNGHRMHRIEYAAPKGYYDSLGNAIDLDGTFPKYTRLFFDTEDKLKVILDIDKAELEKIGKKWFYVFNVEGVEYGINKKYFDDAANGKKALKGHFDISATPSEDEDIRVREQAIEFSPFQSEDKSIMLMPVKLKSSRDK